MGISDDLSNEIIEFMCPTSIDEGRTQLFSMFKEVLICPFADVEVLGHSRGVCIGRSRDDFVLPQPDDHTTPNLEGLRAGLFFDEGKEQVLLFCSKCTKALESGETDSSCFAACNENARCPDHNPDQQSDAAKDEDSPNNCSNCLWKVMQCKWFEMYRGCE